jgi:Ca2+-binding EF-hand superfamily protein
MKTTSVILSLIFCLGFQSPFCLAEEAHYIISHFDINNNDAVSFDEFYIVMIRKKGNAIYDTFSVGDLNQNGVISASEAVILMLQNKSFIMLIRMAMDK